MNHHNFDPAAASTPSGATGVSSFMTITFVTMLFILAYRAHGIYMGYQAYLALGPGGTPSNFPGYIKVSFLGLFALRDAFAPPLVPDALKGKGYLQPIMLCSRPIVERPNVAGIAPHRQIDHKACNELFVFLSAAITALAESLPEKLCIKISAFEKHCNALFAQRKRHSESNGEICHVHPSDGSMHMTLHPEDIKIVLEAGWGERHPLARGGWFTRFVPEYFVMVYAPQSEKDVDTLMKIIEAAVHWISDEKVEELAGGGIKAGGSAIISLNA